MVQINVTVQVVGPEIDIRLENSDYEEYPEVTLEDAEEWAKEQAIEEIKGDFGGPLRFEIADCEIQELSYYCLQ